MKIKFYSFIIFYLFGIVIGRAQELFRMNNIPVFHGSKKLLNPFTGGMNSCAVNQMDLNNDGIMDLVIVHQIGISAGRIQTYLQSANGDYIYAPRYEAFFPKKNSHNFLMRDLNEDNLEDIIIQTDAYFLILYASRTNDTVFQFDFYDSLEFESIYPEYGRTQIIALNKYLPVFEDYDDDGDQDMVYVNRDNHRLYYKNYKKELSLHKNENLWKGENKYYGQFCTGSFSPMTIRSGCKVRQEKFIAPPRTEPILTPRHDEFQMIWNIDINADKKIDAVMYSENQKNAPLGVNIGSRDSAYILQADTFFPSYSSQPINLMMPIGFWYDVNNDNKKDILVSFLIERDFSGVLISQKLFNDDIHTIHKYLNVGKHKVFNPISTSYHDSFVFESSDFLANETIDVGTGSSPVFYDYDKDSLIDLLIPNILKRDSWEIAYITYFKNIGNKQQPLYRLESTDLLNYKSKNRASIKLAVGDLNMDGIDDLLVTSFDRNLGAPFTSNANVPIIGEMYFHKKGERGSFLYLTQNLSLESEYKFGRANICFHDVDKDGKVDMFMGDLQYLKYYRNISTDSIAKFGKPTCDSVIRGLDLVSADYLPFEFSFFPAIWKDTHSTAADKGEYLLFAYDLYGGKVGKVLIDTQKLHNNKPLDVKPEHKSLYPNYSINQLPTIAIKDITNDGKAEIAFGNYAGGVQIFSIDSLTGIKDPPSPPSSIAAVNIDMNLGVYPNPSNSIVKVSGLNDFMEYQIDVFSIDGRLMKTILKYKIDESIDISYLAKGLYWIRISHDKMNYKTIKFQKSE